MPHSIKNPLGGYHKITVTGELGSGKSAVSRILTQHWKWPYHSGGDIYRQIASRRGVSAVELARIAQTDPGVDEEIDNLIRSLGEDQRSMIVDSRTAWHFIPGSFKIRLEVDSEIAAHRVLNDDTRTSESYQDYHAAAQALQIRYASEVARYTRAYGIDVTDDNNFDLIVDTTRATPEDAAQTIIRCAESLWAGRALPRRWIPARAAYPLGTLERLSGEQFDHIRQAIQLRGYDPLWQVNVLRLGGKLYLVDGHRH